LARFSSEGAAFLSFSVDREAKDILFAAVFDGPISDDDQDAVWEIEWAVGAQLDDDWQANTQFVRLEEGGFSVPDRSITLFDREAGVSPKALRATVLIRHGRSP
jgi:hypothetical protein